MHAASSGPRSTNCFEPAHPEKRIGTSHNPGPESTPGKCVGYFANGTGRDGYIA